MLIPRLLALLFAASAVSAELCDKNEFWSSFFEACEECSRCAHPDVVLRPCQSHTDTICGPLSDLNIDWSWLKTKHDKAEEPQKEMLQTFKENLKGIKQHEKHVLEKQKYLRRKEEKEEVEEDDIVGGDILRRKDKDEESIFKKTDSDEEVWQKLKGMSKVEDKVADDLTALERQKHLESPVFDYKRLREHIFRMPFDLDGKSELRMDSKEAAELLKSVSPPSKNGSTGYDQNKLQFDERGVLVKGFGFTKPEERPLGVASARVDEEFTTTERFVLDWQTVILGVGVAAILVFFILAAFYSFQHVKEWRNLRHYFNADVEELQSWLGKDSKKKLPRSGIYRTTTEVVHSEGGQCKYLERIINMNGGNKLNRVPNNLYSDGKHKSEMKPLYNIDATKLASVHQQAGDRL